MSNMYETDSRKCCILYFKKVAKLGDLRCDERIYKKLFSTECEDCRKLTKTFSFQPEMLFLNMGYIGVQRVGGAMYFALPPFGTFL